MLEELQVSGNSQSNYPKLLAKSYRKYRGQNMKP